MKIKQLDTYHNIATQGDKSVLLSYGMIVATSNNGVFKITKIGKEYIKYKDIEKTITKYKELNKEVK